MKSRPPSSPGPGFRPGLFAVGFPQIGIEALEEDMQPFRHILVKTCLLAATLLMVGAAPPFTAAAAPIAATLPVPAGTLQSVQIRNLPKGAMIEIHLQCEGRLMVALVDSEASRNRARPLFAGRLDRKLSFTVTIPQTDDYYIVLDNRKGSADQEVSLLIRGVGPSRGMTPKGSSPL